MPNYPNLLKTVLSEAQKQQASDLTIFVNHPSTLRIKGSLTILNMPKITPVDSQELAFLLMNQEQRQRFFNEKELDFSYDFEQKQRFRINIFYQKGNISCALRLIPKTIKTIEELSLPSILYYFAQKTQGFVLITGPSSHGKSTTLAALIDEINKTRFDHIITVEDPIEYIFEPKKAIIDQREVHHDTLSFPNALRHVLRQDPDVIMIGEMRDAETISTAITAAETGHLVFATLHTNSAGQTIHRIVDSFAPEQQAQIRAQLAISLLGVISQRLIPSTNGELVPACEVMISTPAIANVIRENKIHELGLVVDTSGDIGMMSLNKSLARLVKMKKIALEDALAYSLDPQELRKLIK